MADSATNPPCLTVLGGPLAGTRFVIDRAVDNVLVGSDHACGFRLELPNVSPIHARLWIDASGVTVYDANSPHGLFVNDDRVNGQRILKNGDVLWLGAPGDEEAVMIQCHLPARGGSAAVAPAPAVAEAEADETVVMGARLPEAAAAPPEPEMEIEETLVDAPAPAIEMAADTPAAPTEATTEVFLVDDPLFAATSGNAAAPAIEIDEEPVKFTVELPVSTAVPATPAVELEFEETVVNAPSPAARSGPAPPRPAAPPPPAPPPPRVEPPPAPKAARPATKPPAASAAYPAPPRAARARPAPASAPPARASAARAAAPTPRRRPAPEAAPPAEPAAEEEAAAPRAASPAGRYAVIAVGVVALGLAGALGGRMLRSKQASPAPADSAAPATAPLAPASAAPHAAAAPTTVPSEAPPVVEPVEEIVTILKPSTPPPKPSPVATPAAAKPAPAAGAAKPTAPPPEVAKAQQLATQVAGLLGQAEGAASAKRFDAAIGFYDEVLKLDPQNARASEGKASAQSAVAAAKRAFVPGRTLVDSGKAAKADLGGFDTAGVKVAKAPDFSGRIDFEVSPAHVQPGDNYTMRVHLTNDGKKAFKLGGLTVSVTVNGTKSGGSANLQVKEVEPQQKVLLQELPGAWQPDVKSWTLEVVVTTTHGESFKNQIVWR